MLEAIVAVNRDWGIGADGTQSVVVSADRKHFREVTGGSTVIVGRKTLADFPGGKPLPKRRNIVLTKQNIEIGGAEVAHTPEEALSLAGDGRCFVIGGESVYKALFPHIQRVYVTKLDVIPHSDAFFTDLDADPDWEITDGGAEQTDESGVKFRFVTYERRLSPELQNVRERLTRADRAAYACILNAIARHSLRLHYAGDDGLVAYDETGRLWYGLGDAAVQLPDLGAVRLFVTDSAALAEAAAQRYGLSRIEEYRIFSHLGSEASAPEQSGLRIGAPAPEDDLSVFHFLASEDDRKELERDIREGRFFVGHDADGALVGCCGINPDTSMGMLEVLPAYRRMGYAEALEGYTVRQVFAMGLIPNGQVAPENAASAALQRKLGLTEAEHRLWFVWP